MDQTHNFSAQYALPKWKDPEAARRELKTQMDAFIRKAAEAEFTDDEACPALTFKVSAGVGKTSTALKLLARHGRALLARGHVLVYMPTLELAARAAMDLAELGSGLPISVIRGRLADDFNTGEPICKQKELVQAVTNLVPSVTQALCRSQQGGETTIAQCANGCLYLAQMDAVGARIHFLSHKYLGTFPPIDREIKTALRIVDEKVWPTLVSSTDIYVEDFMRAPKSQFPANLIADLNVAKSGIIAALQAGSDVRVHLLSHGLDKEKLGLLSKAETASRNVLNISPRDSPEKI